MKPSRAVITFTYAACTVAFGNSWSPTGNGISCRLDQRDAMLTALHKALQGAETENPVDARLA